MTELVVSMVLAASVSHWDGEHRLIVTERRWMEGGVERQQTVLGGTVDGITMVQIPLLRPGVEQLVPAYVPSVNSHGKHVYWPKSCVFVRPGTPSTELPGDDLPVFTAAFAAWVGPTRGCGFLDLKLEPRETGDVAFDYVNRIIYREQRWCIPARPGVPENCHDPRAIGLTTLFYRDLRGAPDDGVIFDADIELNAVDFALGFCEADGGCATNGTGPLADLQNTFTHETGHLLGLDHTCNNGGPEQFDGQGQVVPMCSLGLALPASVREAVMYPLSSRAEISKRTLSADDVDGFCATYPLAKDPGDCSPVTPPVDAGVATDGGPSMNPPPHGCGCGQGAGLTAWLAAGALLLLRRPRRSRSRR